MNKRQEAFVEHFTATGNAAESAREANYSLAGDDGARAGNQVMRSTEVQLAVAKRIAEAEVATRLTPEYVLSALMHVVEKALASENLPAATAAARELGRHLQLFTDRIDITDMRSQAQQLADEAGIDVEELEGLALKMLPSPK